MSVTATSGSLGTVARVAAEVASGVVTMAVAVEESRGAAAAAAVAEYWGGEESSLRVAREAVVSEVR